MRVVLQAALAAAMTWPTATIAATREPAAEARIWLRLIDQGRFADSWSQAGVLFRGAATQAEWARKVSIARGPLGALLARSDGGDQRSTTLPGAPDGRYATIQFNTTFAHKHAAVETLILALEPGGWRVDGYFIR
jgi:hypothetical protein